MHVGVTIMYMYLNWTDTEPICIIYFPQLCVGTSWHWVYARNVRPCRSASSYIRRWITQLWLFLSFNGTNDWKFSQWQCHGYAFCEYAVIYMERNDVQIVIIVVFAFIVGHSYKYWTLKCMIWWTPMAIIHTFILLSLVPVGF